MRRQENMKRLSPRNWNQFRSMFGVLLLIGLAALLLTSAATAQRSPAPQSAKRVGAVIADKPAFFARSYGGKCLDFGRPPHVNGSPVFIYSCNGSIAQQIRIQEIDNLHEVILRAGDKVIGVKSDLVIGPIEPGATMSEAESPVELQDEKDRNTIASRGQIFALDGDSIILVANPDSVIKVKNNRGEDRTPLVLGHRDLADSEFWTFDPTDNSNRKPTSGFVRVPQEKDFLTAISDVSPDIHPGVVSRGTVIEVDQVSIDLTDAIVRIPEGVTIRSNRRGINWGAELWTDRVGSNDSMLEVAGYDVRITGLRLRGPSRSTDTDNISTKGILPSTKGILVPDRRYKRTIIDHNDISDWTKAGVSVEGGGRNTFCGNLQPPFTYPQNTRVVRNFIHHNRKQGKGYGVESSLGAWPLIEGNTFYENRHAIAADADSETKYRAWYNLVLAAAPGQKKLFGIVLWHTHDFDSHGNGPNGFGGQAGQFFEIHRNTFLGRNRNNYKLRGSGCYGVEFHDNVSVRKRDKSVKCDSCGMGINSLSYPASLNHFGADDPTAHLGVGDFDGDGTDDLFLATGAAWYYAPHGVAEWRFINTQTDGIGTLLFGDFDHDRRTDVFTQHGRDWLISWGGASQWEKINDSPPLLSEFRIGDFIGDSRSDVFYADGQHWWVSDGGTGPLTMTQDSGYRATSLGFGDFNGDGKTDVVGAVSGKWAVSLSATGGWGDYPLRSALTKITAEMIIADFNGNGRADIATAYVGKVSYDGRSDWVDFPKRPGLLSAVGRFDASLGADILYFPQTGDHHDDYLGIQSSGNGTARRHSRQHMR